MGRSDSKNEKDGLGKVQKTDPKTWESLIHNMRRTDSEKLERLTQKYGKVLLKKFKELNPKSTND